MNIIEIIEQLLGPAPNEFIEVLYYIFAFSLFTLLVKLVITAVKSIFGIKF